MFLYIDKMLYLEIVWFIAGFFRVSKVIDFLRSLEQGKVPNK